MQPAAVLLHLFLWTFNMGITMPAPPALPQNIWVQEELRPIVARLLQGSPTFRAQVERIAAVRHFRVNVLVDASLTMNRWCRAQCVMRSYSTGLVIASVSVPNMDAHNIELIPHEFEHVIERIDGINVRRQLNRNAPGVYSNGDGRIETERAKRVGRQARIEMQTVMLLTTRGPTAER